MCSHGFPRPIDGWDGDAFALCEGGGDEGVEGELVGERGVSEDGGGGGDGGVGEEVGRDGCGDEVRIASDGWNQRFER